MDPHIATRLFNDLEYFIIDRLIMFLAIPLDINNIMTIATRSIVPAVRVRSILAQVF